MINIELLNVFTFLGWLISLLSVYGHVCLRQDSLEKIEEWEEILLKITFRFLIEALFLISLIFSYFLLNLSNLTDDLCDTINMFLK